MIDNILKLCASAFLLSAAAFLAYFVANMVRDDLRYRKTK